MKYKLIVELVVEFEFLNIDALDEDAKEEIEDIVVEALSDNSSEITKNIFDEMKQHTHVKIKNGFAYEDERSTNAWDDCEEELSDS
jgi:hypothetical protein